MLWSKVASEWQPKWNLNQSIENGDFSELKKGAESVEENENTGSVLRQGAFKRIVAFTTL